MAVFDAATIVAKKRCLKLASERKRIQANPSKSKRRLKLASESKRIQATLEICKQMQANPSDA